MQYNCDNANAFILSTFLDSIGQDMYRSSVHVLKLTPGVLQDHPKMETRSRFSADERAAVNEGILEHAHARITLHNASVYPTSVNPTDSRDISPEEIDR